MPDTKADRTLPVPGEVWQHFHGGDFEVVCLSTDGATGQSLVTFRPHEKPGPTLTRPVFWWMQRVTLSGTTAFRFSRAVLQDLPAKAPGIAQDATEEVPVPGPTPNQSGDVYG